MNSKLEDICNLLSKAGALLRPIGFLDPKDSPVGVYAGLPIQDCQSIPMFSNFTARLCGLSDQWHAHFPAVQSQGLSAVLGIYLPGNPSLVGFLSLPGEAEFDKSFLQPITDDAYIVELPIAELPGQDSRIALLGDSPELDVAFVGGSQGMYRVFAEANCRRQSFDIYGVFASSPRPGSMIPEESVPRAGYLEKLAQPWLGQNDIQGQYQLGFLFIAKAVSSEITGVPVIDHEELLTNSIGFQYPDSSLSHTAEPWSANASLALATYMADPVPAKAEEAARWLLAVDDVLANFHFPELWELHAKHFPVALQSDENPLEGSGFCASCGEEFEFNSDTFCGNCGEAREVS